MSWWRVTTCCPAAWPQHTCFKLNKEKKRLRAEIWTQKPASVTVLATRTCHPLNFELSARHCSQAGSAVSILAHRDRCNKPHAFIWKGLDVPEPSMGAAQCCCTSSASEWAPRFLHVLTPQWNSTSEFPAWTLHRSGGHVTELRVWHLPMTEQDRALFGDCSSSSSPPSHTTNRPEAEDEPKLPSRAVPPAQRLLLDKELQVLRLLIWLCGLVVNPSLKLSVSSFTRLNAAARRELTRGPGQLEEKLHFYKLCFFKAYEVKRRARTQNWYLKCKTGSSVAELSRSSPTKHTGISAQIPVQDNEAWRIVCTMQFSFPPNRKSQKPSPAPSCLYNIYLLNKQMEDYPRYLNSALNFTE